MKIRAQQIIGLCSLLINVLPFLVYPLLITQTGGQFTNFLPFAIYYAFRRTALILFRDWEHDYPMLGKIGLLSGLVGAILGLFGSLSPIFWDASGVGTGLASVLFPTAINQNKRLAKIQRDNNTKSAPGKLVGQLFIILAILAVVAICRWSFFNFAILLLANISALCCYQYRHHRISRPVHSHWSNYFLGVILFLAMFSIRIGRSIGIGQPITWGITLLAVFLLLMTVLLITNWHGRFISPTFHREAVFYGVCGQYWSMYSTIFVGVTAGVDMYYWVIVAYLLAMIFGSLFARLVYHYLAVDRLSLSLILTALGITMTFWLPAYFVGIFLIRTFASQIRQMATTEYEQQTNNYHLSYIVNYNYATAGGMVSQLVMWGSLFLLLRNKGLSNALTDFAQHHSSLSNISAITGAHLILAAYMILFIVWLLVDQFRLQHSTANN